MTKESGKTKKELVDEVTALKDRIAELEAIEKLTAQAQIDFGEKIGRYFPQVEHMDEAMYVLFDRKYEFVNKRFAEMFQVTSEEACSPHFDPMTLVAPESRRYIKDKFRKGATGEFKTQQYEYTGVTKNGSFIECETFVLFIPYKWGVAVHGMLRNITVRKRIDEELQRNRSDLQIVLNSIPTSIFYTDVNHRFIRANKAFCKSIGFPMESIIGKTLTELFPNLPEEQLFHFFDVNERVMNSGNSKRGFIEIFPSVRGRRWIQNDRVPYRDDNGNIIGVICIAIDISDFRETEEKLWYLSFHDVLTGLYNRTYFEEEMYRLENGRQFPISVVAIRVDELQAVNDRDGIAAGNELLRRTAKILKIFRTEDVVARISGEKFAALLPLSDKVTGENIIRRLKETLETQNKHYRGEPLHLSFGVATGEKGGSLPDVLKEAESSMRRKRKS
jgi:diguanylate cyclase (GGDEF)-like protein/PAS domain S-box-containing protein